MATILLINPSYTRTYGTAKASIASPVYPILGLATIAAVARRQGHRVRIMDLSYIDYDPGAVKAEILDTKPDIVGVTATTPLMNQLRDISCLVKDISREIVTIGGGAHPSALPMETMHESMLDFVVFGEGDYSFAEIADGRDPAEIPGVCYRKNGQVVQNAYRPLIENLDDLPMPAIDLFRPEEYRHRVSRLIVTAPPASMVEFSRGCVFRCDFCGSKNTMGLGLRKKSPDRCAEEMDMLYKLGFREAILADDIFTSHNAWAEAVCEALIKRGNKVRWTCTNGIRVDSAKSSLFRKMHQAGCYRVHFGFESGNDHVLEAFGKGGKATLEQGRVAVQMAREAKMDTFGMYMLGLSADTEESMQDTIDYGKTTPVDMMRCGITIPLPGTPMFHDLRRAGRIRTYNWDLYNVYNTSPIFDHPHLSHDVVGRYYKKFYHEAFYKNPKFMIRRFLRGLRTGEFFWDLYYFCKFVFVASENVSPSYPYAFEAQWPRYHFRSDNVRPIQLMTPLTHAHVS